MDPTAIGASLMLGAALLALGLVAAGYWACWQLLAARVDALTTDRDRWRSAHESLERRVEAAGTIAEAAAAARAVRDEHLAGLPRADRVGLLLDGGAAPAPDPAGGAAAV